MNKPTNVDRLRAAGVLSDHPDHLEDDHHEAINGLSSDEVDALISVHEKVGPVDVKGHPTGRAWII